MRTSRSSRFGTGLFAGTLLGLTGGILLGWWAAGGPLPSVQGWTLSARQTQVAGMAKAKSPEIVAPPTIDQNQSALREAIRRGGGLTIGVFGDSMADGLWTGLYRQLRDVEGVKVVRFSRPSTGLSRYDYLNVDAQTVAQLAGQRVDIAVFMIGANDRQGIQGEGKALAFASPDWRAAYSGRVDALVAHARNSGAAVYWLGLPRMRSPGAESGAELVNGIFSERAAALGYPYFDSTGLTSDASKAYAAYLPIGPGGRLQMARSSDGIHMTSGGYLLLAEPIARQIKADLAEARSAVATQPTAAPVQAAKGAGAVSATGR